MHSIDLMKRLAWLSLGLIGACTPPAPAPTQPSPTAAPAVAPAVAPKVAAPAPGPAAAVRLPTPATMRNWADVRQQAAHRMVAANPTLTYTGAVPDPLLAIPVLEIELNADGSVRRIDVLRKPKQATDTVQIAIDAVHRAAPFGDVSRLPKPWRFVETFLFNDERRFKPRTLDR